MRCNACGGEYNRLEILFPPVPAQELKPAKDGDALRHVKTGELYRTWQLCESCMEAIKAHGGGMIAISFKLKQEEDAEEIEREAVDALVGITPIEEIEEVA